MQKPGNKDLLGCGTIFDGQQAKCKDWQLDFYVYETDYEDESCIFEVGKASTHNLT